MRSYRIKPHYLGVFFVLAVIVPAIALSLLAVRTISHEEAFMEKQLANTLLAEVTHTVSLINAQIQEIEEGLDHDAYAAAEPSEAIVERWKKANPFVDVAFILSPGFELVYPASNTAISRQQASFLDEQKEFLSNAVPVSVYKNIAVEYQKAINDESSKLGLASDTAAKESKSDTAASEQEDDGLQKLSEQRAISQWEQYPQIRDKIYAKARSKGQVASRLPLQSMATRSSDQTFEQTAASAAPADSQFVMEMSHFSELTSTGERGLICRFVDEKLKVIFWKRYPDGSILGCEINGQKLKDRVIGALPPIYSPTRIITVLDENASPLIVPSEKLSRNWRTPFLSREIGESLPRWEVAVYLTDPAAVSEKARLSALVLWVLIGLLFISLASGGFVILRSLYSQMRLAQQKTTFVANVSHELKTPLTSIRMFAEMLKEKPHLEEERKAAYLGLVVSEAQRLTRLINNVLDFSRLDQGKKRYTFAEVDLAALCDEVFNEQRLHLENNGFTVRLTVKDKPLVVRADAEAITQALINIISNAEKYSPETKDIEMEAAREGAWATISIKDKGIGVPAHEVQNIFKEFYRVDDSLTAKVKGTGLGLAIAKRILQEHGGDIVYIPHEGHGSIFQVRLALEKTAER